ncbi:hypothetical protein IU433_00115 [Nocardia puris]|nr:hypothetical protein [Nocardia puris]MBF6457452.1 hypothetical protein [Nocardia puris]
MLFHRLTRRGLPLGAAITTAAALGTGHPRPAPAPQPAPPLRRADARAPHRTGPQR